MKSAAEVFDWLGGNTYPEQEVILEVGGDGAVHTGSICSVRIEDGKAILSTEEQ